MPIDTTIPHYYVVYVTATGEILKFGQALPYQAAIQNTDSNNQVAIVEERPLGTDQVIGDFTILTHVVPEE